MLSLARERISQKPKLSDTDFQIELELELNIIGKLGDPKPRLARRQQERERVASVLECYNTTLSGRKSHQQIALPRNYQRTAVQEKSYMYAMFRREIVSSVIEPIIY